MDLKSISQESRNLINFWEGFGGILANQNGNLIGLMPKDVPNDSLKKLLWDNIKKNENEIIKVVVDIVGNGEWVDVQLEEGQTIKDFFPLPLNKYYRWA